MRAIKTMATLHHTPKRPKGQRYVSILFLIVLFCINILCSRICLASPDTPSAPDAPQADDDVEAEASLTHPPLSDGAGGTISNDGDVIINDDEDDDEYIDLEEMTDEELEEICTSRGFELVKEVDEATGEPVEYSHQEYVEAAMECLQIESDLEEILQKHPEILEDVRKESERMMRERDRLQEQLDQLQKQTEGGTAYSDGSKNNNDSASPWGVGTEGTVKGGGASEMESTATNNISDGNNAQQSTDNNNSTSPASVSTTSQRKPIYDIKEIISEVNQQIKADITKVINFIAPEPLRKQVQPALKTFVTIARDTGVSVYDLMKRYMMAFLEKSTTATATDDDDTSASGQTTKEPSSNEQQSANDKNGEEILVASLSP